VDVRRLVAAGGVMGLLGLAVAVGGLYAPFVDLPAVLTVVGVATLVWWLACGARVSHLVEVLRAQDASPRALEAAVVTARQLRRAVWAAAAVGAGVGTVQLVLALDDPWGLPSHLTGLVLTVTYAGLADLFVASPLRADLEARRVLCSGGSSVSQRAGRVPSSTRGAGMLSRTMAGGFAAFVLMLAILVGSPLGHYIDLASAILVVGGGALAWRMTSGRQLSRLFSTLRADTPSAAELELAALTLSQGRRAMWLVGGVSTLIGFVQMLTGLADPAAIGPAMAVALLTLFYPLLLELFVFLPLRATIEQKAVPIDESSLQAAAIARELDASRAALHKLKQARRTRQ